MSREIKRTNCHYCGYLCAFNATVEDGRIVDIEPDPTRYPYDPQILAGCRRWRMNLEMLDSPDRINHPLRRVGERGSGEWERISWDEALDGIAAKLSELKAQHGAGTLASMIGGPHTSFWPLHRFMSLFGSPNNMGIGQICWNPRIWMDVLTFGWTIEADITAQTNTLLIWGTNPAESDNSVFWRHLLKMSRAGRKGKGSAAEDGEGEGLEPKGGATGAGLDVDSGDETANAPHPKIIVIDPRFTKTARIADVWLAPRPGTDCTLALGMINVIVEEGLHDREFVEKWCHGFDELVEHVRPFTPEHAAEVCGVSADDIRMVAREFAKSPSAVVSGRGIDQVGANVAPTHRARCIMLAITGNLDKPGANCLAEPSEFVEELDLECTLLNFEALKELSLNEGITPLQSYGGYDQVLDAIGAYGKRLPARYLTSAHPDLVLRAIETGEPYPITALIVEATNPLLTYADTHRVLAALKKLDLIVVLDYFMTPTAQIADYVLPSAAAMERATFQAHGGVANMAYGGPAACAPYYERKVDYDVFRELGLRLGQADSWPDETFEDAIASTLAPTGMDWETYCEVGMCAAMPEFFKHERLHDDGTFEGFATRTGKVELASEMLAALGGERLPLPAENRTLCSEGFMKEREAAGWMHCELMTGGRRQPYNASMYMNNLDFRKRAPYPLVEMGERTAADIGVSDGDCVVIASDNGEARFKVKIVDIRYGLVHADYGWWHPEWPCDARLGGIFESNVNTLTSCSLDQSEPMIGTWSYNAMDCMVKKDEGSLTFDDLGL